MLFFMYVSKSLFIKYKWNQLVQSQYTKIHYFKQHERKKSYQFFVSVYSHMYETHIFLVFFTWTFCLGYHKYIFPIKLNFLIQSSSFFWSLNLYCNSLCFILNYRKHNSSGQHRNIGMNQILNTIATVYINSKRCLVLNNK